MYARAVRCSGILKQLVNGKNQSPVQNKGVAALSAGDSNVQPSGDTARKI